MPSKKNPKKTSKDDDKMTTKEGKITTLVTNQPLVTEMQRSYLDYAMSVIVSRALPDVRDGLKPVHRRILYAMWDIGLKSNAKFRKSANVVGEVMAKYHPHGDQAIYDSLARMAQDFAMRYPLIWGQGNFGSMDGDSPAAMRYTEAKLAQIAEEMIFDIDKDTVEFGPNYDGAHNEPKCMPAKLPQLLLNGVSGIAVGMATNIPPHHLGELISGINMLLDNPESGIDDLCKVITGPDFPTGGVMYDIKAIKDAYITGRGSVVLRAVTEIVERGKNDSDFDIIVSEVPYQVNKSNLLEKIADLVRNKKIEGIKDLRDESDRNGVRIVIELKRGTFPKKILNQLYKHTQLQDSFSFNMVALVDGIQPQLLGLKEILKEYIKHRRDVVKRRTQYDLKQAEDRAHILEGLMLALNKIDDVIKTIKSSKDNNDAREKLIKKFKLSEKQAIAILEMRLRQLASLERLKIETELKEKRHLIKELTALLKSQKKMDEVIKDELSRLNEKYADERKTKIIPHAVDKFTQEDLIPNESTVITLTRDGFIKRLPPETFRTQARGGKGVVGLTTREEDSVKHFFSTSTHKDVLFFTNKGRVFQLKAYEIPITSRTAKGQSIVNFLQLGPEEIVNEIVPLDRLEKSKFLIMVTKKGITKKVELNQFQNVRRSGLIAIRLGKEDALREVKPATTKDDVILITKLGQAIRFHEKGLRAMGRPATGVRGIRLKKDDEVIGMCIVSPQNKNLNTKILVVSENGFGKMTPSKEYRIQTRGGSGIRTTSTTTRIGHLVSSFALDPKNLPEEKKGDLIIISEKGQVIRLPLKSVSTLGRATQGVSLMKFKEPSDKTVSVTLL